jgi:XRE family transcriptional regulator, fatty acid utilization regulator
MMSLGKEIRKARVDIGMNQKALAERSKLSQKYMSQIERDDADPRFSIVQRIAEALGVSLDQLGKKEPHA